MPEPEVRVINYRTHLRLSRRVRFRYWLGRKRLEWKYGKHIIEMMDECSAAAERAFIYGQEHDVAD